LECRSGASQPISIEDLLMSVQALYTAATGMEALETKLDVIANNLANVSTVGFKKDRANFEDLFYRHEVIPGTEQAAPETGVGISVGLGTRVSSVQSDLGQGSGQMTNRPSDLMIQGPGYFQVSDANGNFFYTRAGNFTQNANGFLVMGSGNQGRILEPNIQIPNDATNLTINEDGSVFVMQPGDTAPSQIGQLQLTMFSNPAGLLKMGDNLYQVSEASGQGQELNPGQQGAGILRQNMLENSNVEPVRELIDLIQTQRNFELISQAVQTGDQMMQLISNLRR
jgi:flagellar basal-body rod protein FlgG